MLTWKNLPNWSRSTTGKPIGVARVADVPLAVDLFRYMAGWRPKSKATRSHFGALHARRPYHAYTLREPVGVVAQDHTWNFPLLMAAWKTRPSVGRWLYIVLKPAEQTPLSACDSAS